MTLPTYDEALASARPGPPFANGEEGFGWMARWCDRCVHDRSARDDTGSGCDLVAVAMMADRTPAAWLDGPRDEHGRYSIAHQYTCVYFRDEDDPGPDEPTPIPDPPGQDALFPREGIEGVRMLTTYPAAVAEVAR